MVNIENTVNSLSGQSTSAEEDKNDEVNLYSAMQSNTDDITEVVKK